MKGRDLNAALMLSSLHLSSAVCWVGLTALAWVSSGEFRPVSIQMLVDADVAHVAT